MTDAANRSKIHQMASQWHARMGRIGVSHYSSVEFLIALVLLLVLTPIVQELPHARVIEGALLTLVLGSAVLAVGAEPRTFFIALALSIPAVTARWVHHFFPAIIPAEVFPVAGMMLVGYVVYHLLRYILNASRVNRDVLCAGVAAYLTIGLLWAFAYLLTSRANPHAFSLSGQQGKYDLNGFDTLYFSYVTLTTVGFGDITPISPMARMLAVLEALTGTMYLAVLVARLVGMNSSGAEIPVRTDHSQGTQ